MSRPATTESRWLATALSGHAGAGLPAPYLVLDLGRGRDPHQARCRSCRWRSSWRATAAQAQAQAQAEHARHQAAAHGRGRRPARRGRRGLLTWGRVW
jgi:hypothetical protein